MFAGLQQSKIEVQPMKLSDLLTTMAQGNLQMPRFQREFVWPVSKTRALLDSMYKEYPIGTLFFWQAPSDEAALIIRELTDLQIPAPQPHQQISFILDGQQRLTSLYAAWNGFKLGTRDYGNIHLDLVAAALYEADKELFEGDIFVSPRSVDKTRHVSFQSLLTSDLTVYEQLPAEYRPIFQTALQRFTTYPFSVVWVRDQPLSEVVEIFQRINQGGKRLSSYDLVCANLWSKSFNFRQEVETLNNLLVSKNFGKIDTKVIPQAITLIKTGKSSQTEQLRLKSDEVQLIWDDVRRAILRSVDFLHNNLGVARSDFLPYGGLLSLLSIFFYEWGSKALTAEARQAIWRWFWSVSAAEWYSVASREKINADATRMHQLAAGEAVDWPTLTPASADQIAQVNMRSSSALRNVLMCMLALQQPRNFKDGSPVNLSADFFSSVSKAERHHIFPISFLKKQGIVNSRVHQLANFAFIPSALNKEISNKAPSDYMTRYRDENSGFEADVQTHLIAIDTNSAIWVDEFDAFLQQRSLLLTKQLHTLIDTGLDSIKPETPAAFTLPADSMIASVELQLRDLIDAQLRAVGGDQYWNSAVPQGIQNKVNNKIGKHVQASPWVNPADYADGRKKLDFCDIGDYISIIKTNWSDFSTLFGNQDNALRHLDDFRQYRNMVAHNNHDEITDVMQKTGEAALLWLQQVFDTQIMQEDE